MVNSQETKNNSTTSIKEDINNHEQIDTKKIFKSGLPNLTTTEETVEVKTEAEKQETAKPKKKCKTSIIMIILILIASAAAVILLLK